MNRPRALFAALILCITLPTIAAAASDIKRGERLYQRFCALCHGQHLEGQANWRIRKPDGKLPAPPHDASGHTWHHTDADLFGMTKFGMVPPYAPAGYATDMPGWEATLKDADIRAVLEYIKSTWPEEKRAYQRRVTKGR